MPRRWLTVSMSFGYALNTPTLRIGIPNRSLVWSDGEAGHRDDGYGTRSETSEGNH